jgi:hypothetical protein
MATVRFMHAEIKAQPISQRPDGSWVMRAQSHGPRFTIGDQILIRPSEIISMEAAEMPTVTYTTAPPSSPVTQDTHKMSKFSELAATVKSTVDGLEADADKRMARAADLKAKAAAGMARIDQIQDNYDAGLKDLENIANQLSNGGPLAGK